MKAISVFRTIQVGFLVMLMVFIAYCNRINQVQSAIKPNQTALINKADSVQIVNQKMDLK